MVTVAEQAYYIYQENSETDDDNTWDRLKRTLMWGCRCWLDAWQTGLNWLEDEQEDAEISVLPVHQRGWAV
jgi:hypothetical protein